ncbi:MAG: PDZ domain-containing protein [Chloroflexi bacterium]|nr:PDZ domain-containing protein [Chloroflexota bacterium]
MDLMEQTHTTRHRRGRRQPLLFVIVVLALAMLACTSALSTLGLSNDGDGEAVIVDGVANDENVAGDDETAVDDTQVAVVTPTPLPDDLISQADAEEQLLINLYQRASPAVVSIDVSREGPSEGDLIDVGEGSGFVIDPSGLIITNDHVIEDANAVRVTFIDGRVYEAEVRGSDPFADIAVLEIDPGDDELVSLNFADSEALLVGQRVIAIGNPLGLSGTMTVGFISALGRALPSQVTTSAGGFFSNPLIIQTDAAINPGNSGGPLLNSSGEVIGVNYAIRTETGFFTGISFAVPANTAKRISDQIIATGEVRYPYMGISSNAEVTLAELSLEFDLPVAEGVLISEVVPGAAADRAGLLGGDDEVIFRGSPLLLGGDIITAINGVRIRNFDELIGYLVTNTSAGEVVTVSIVRDGEAIDIEMELDERPE